MVVVDWVAAVCAAWLVAVWMVARVVAYAARAVRSWRRRVWRGVSVPRAVIDASVAVRFWWFWCAAMMRGCAAWFSIWVRSVCRFWAYSSGVIYFMSPAYAARISASPVVSVVRWICPFSSRSWFIFSSGSVMPRARIASSAVWSSGSIPSWSAVVIASSCAWVGSGVMSSQWYVMVRGASVGRFPSVVCVSMMWLMMAR